MNPEGKFTGRGDDEQRMAENRRAERKRVFEDYVSHFGLGEAELMSGKNILDVGAGKLAAFADYTRQMNMNCRVVSLDTEKFIDVSSDGIDQGNNLKIGETDFGSLDLKKKLGLRQEPQFDIILSHRSAPYMIGRERERIDGRETSRENAELIRNEMAAVIRSTLEHLKKGGRAIFYPINKSEIVEGGGRRRDFRAWRKILEETLEMLVREEEGYVFWLEDTKPERGVAYQRLTIMRKF
jgi:hypothetical protein